MADKQQVTTNNGAIIMIEKIAEDNFTMTVSYNGQAPAFTMTKAEVEALAMLAKVAAE